MPDWIERRVNAAIEAANASNAPVPSAVAELCKQLMEGPLQQPLKTDTLKNIVEQLAAANRGE